jgi:uncharacterized Zn finger protein
MIGICPKCGNFEWNKEVSREKKYLFCQKCGHKWKSYTILCLMIQKKIAGLG